MFGFMGKLAWALFVIGATLVAAGVLLRATARDPEPLAPRVVDAPSDHGSFDAFVKERRRRWDAETEAGARHFDERTSAEGRRAAGLFLIVAGAITLLAGVAFRAMGKAAARALPAETLPEAVERLAEAAARGAAVGQAQAEIASRPPAECPRCGGQNRPDQTVCGFCNSHIGAR